MAKVRERKRARTWSLWTEERRIPTEYEIVTHKINNHFRHEPVPFELDKDDPLNRWYQSYREGSPFQVDDWENFRDPHRLTYRQYIKLQNERESYLDNLIDEYERLNHFARLPRPWVELLQRLYIPTRFSGHIQQMVALYVLQMAPSGYISNAADFQGGDEMRRVQRSAYLAKALSLEQYPDLADSAKTRSIWEEDPHWQPARELLEKLMIAYDWGEAFAALNLVTKPVYDMLFNHQFSALARRNGDELLAHLMDDFELDSQRSRDWTKALVAYAIERQPEHRDLLKGWIGKWSPLAYNAASGLAALFAQAPQPMNADEVAEAVRSSHQAFLADAGLT